MGASDDAPPPAEVVARNPKAEVDEVRTSRWRRCRSVGPMPWLLPPPPSGALAGIGHQTSHVADVDVAVLCPLPARVPSQVLDFYKYALRKDAKYKGTVRARPAAPTGVCVARSLDGAALALPRR